jgi:hypothetical protein
VASATRERAGLAMQAGLRLCTEDNKAVVRRFIENVASGRDVSVADDVLAPGYVNLAFEAVDIAV